MKPLLPIRHPNKDFFVCDIFDALPDFRDDMASMEHPIFSLSTKPDTRTLRYENNGKSIEIIPSILGLATIHDKDVLIYCISYLYAAFQSGYEVSQRIRIKAHDLLVSSNRPTNDLGYKRLEEAFKRLKGTQIVTNVKSGGYEEIEGFGIIENWHIVRKDGRTGRMLAIEIKLSDWFFNAISGDALLTIHPDYFRLRKPLERRLYEIGRKHCGDQEAFTIGLEKLKHKTGSTSPDRLFKSYIKKIAETDQCHKHFPDYGLYLNDNNTMTFQRRRASKNALTSDDYALQTWAYEKAKKAAPGLDIYAAEQDFKIWIKDKSAPEKGYEAAFIGFCKTKAKQLGLIY